MSGQGARLRCAMHPQLPNPPRVRRAVAVLACIALGGCSLWHHDAKPGASTAAAEAASVPASMPAPAPLPPTSGASTWAVLQPRHLDPATLAGQTWVFPSANPALTRDNRFVFKPDRVEASNARDHAVGKWTIDRDRVCVTLGAGATGSACYVTFETAPGQLQIRVLPDGERLPLTIR